MGIQCGHKLRFRKYFKKNLEVMNIPNLIEIQKKSYDDFLQKHSAPDNRRNFGLEGVFKSVFPITSYNNSAEIEFVHYVLGDPKYELEECRQKELTYGVSVKVLVRLISYDIGVDKDQKTIRDIKEQEVYFGEIPLMTETGTFVINGKERVVVSQLHRSPGVFFDHDKGKTLSSGKFLYSARIIPNRGSWIDIEMDTKDIINVRIDRRRKFPATVLLKALGYTEQELLRLFYTFEDVYFENGSIKKTIRAEFFPDTVAVENIVDPASGAVLVKKGRKIKKEHVRKIRDANVETIGTSESELEGKIFAEDVIDPETQEVLFKCNGVIDAGVFPVLKEKKISAFKILSIDNHNVCASMCNTLAVDKVKTTEEAVSEIYKRLRPNDPPSQESANQFFERLFFNSEHYDLSTVGRLKLNESLGRDISLDVHTLDKEDIIQTVRRILEIKNGHGGVDDIDHLGNRRVRTVGELVENHFRIGLVRMERAIREKMSLQDTESLMPNDMINSKLVSAVIKEFFGSSQLSQFMDQTNPLSEITHKRRLSALGPGGLTRERAGFEVRDVHPTHYGRICPIETPEGPNIGLIASLSTFAKVNQYGFIETPYRKVVSGRVTDDVEFLTALQEEKYCIAQANAALDEAGRLIDDLVTSRKEAEFVMAEKDDIEYMDVSPKQLVSVAASLIPFLEHDDANRALMGSNMQRQGVPLMNAEAPLVGTGMESVVARDSGVAVVAKRDGVVRYVDAERVVVKCEEEDNGSVGADIDIYKLIKYRRSNQNTCINQKPIVRMGDYVQAGDIIADGPATEMGELAMGRNVLVAFMPWGGYNFEDSILVSERLVKEDTFTSIHIEEFQVVARDTKLGKEEITRDIPNVGDEMLRNLDESGIVRIGAEVKTDDILVGKITPKGETQLSPEEKLLRAIFGEKARDVQATPLKVPSGIEGTVISVNVFSRKGADKDERTRSIEDEERAKILKDQEEEIRLLKESVSKKLQKILSGKTVKKIADDKKTKTLLSKNHVITDEDIEKIPLKKWASVKVVEDADIADKIEAVRSEYEAQIRIINSVFESKIEKIKKGDELPPGVIKMVKVSLAVKRKLSVGDKMAGRHGNKGVLSRILPAEDMPYLEDGTPVDIVLNPLGVPSRMNVGQILETHLGWAALGLGKKIEEMMRSMETPKKIKQHIKDMYSNSPDIQRLLNKLDDDQVLDLARNLSRGVHVTSPVFDGVSETDIEDCFREVGLPPSGQTVLFDGRTGEPFNRDVTVGVIYIMKLHHLVDDKIHARSIGSYSLVTQQPLGGKAQFGGQRLGEMEVWALEAYGAAHTLQELLTLKSDDVYGRTKLYENIVKGEIDLVPSLPESFNVLVKELQSLCLDVQFLEGEQPQ